MARFRRLLAHLGVAFFNSIGTHIPSHHIRLGLLRLWGAKIGRDCSILMGSTVLGIEELRIGEATSIGFRCLLDARGGLTIGSNVVIASDTHFIGGYHDVNSPNFEAIVEPVFVEDYVWIAARATILTGLTISRGAVVGACALVTEDIAAMSMVAGVPAKPVGTRTSTLEYRPVFRPPFF